MSDPVRPADWLDEIRWDEHGLVPAIAQDAQSGRVLMLAWMDRAALAATAQTGEAVYYSRSRARLWRKGEESGHVQRVREIRTDCDNDVVLLKVEQAGGSRATPAGPPASSGSSWTGAGRRSRRSCGRRRKSTDARGEPMGTEKAVAEVLERLADVIERRKGADPDASYVGRLLARGEDAILKKVGEEATELVMAGKDGTRLRIVEETADLWFHCLIALAHYGLRPSDVLMELRRREGISGIDEKAARQDGIRIEAETRK